MDRLRHRAEILTILTAEEEETSVMEASDLVVRCDVTQGTPYVIRCADGKTLDLAPCTYFADLAEAYWCDVLRGLYDLDETERILRESLPRPREMTATMLKGKRIAVVAPAETIAAFAARAQGWDIQVVETASAMATTGPYDVVVGLARFAPTSAAAVGRVVVTSYRPALELREAVSDALLKFAAAPT